MSCWGRGEVTRDDFKVDCFIRQKGGTPPGIPRSLCKMRSWSTSALLATGSCSQFSWLAHAGRDVGELVKGFPIGMRPLGSHGFLYGWHLAVLCAVEANDKRRVEMLCEAALTATITLYADCDKPTPRMHAMHFLRLFAIPLLRWWTPPSHLLGSAMR